MHLRCSQGGKKATTTTTNDDDGFYDKDRDKKRRQTKTKMTDCQSTMFSLAAIVSSIAIMSFSSPRLALFPSP